jgi:amino acid transporter
MSVITQAKRILIGKPIATKHAHHQRLSNVFALPVFASDALSSVAYATEQTMWVLAAAGTLYFNYTFGISLGITALIVLVSISYYQTIHAYPQGGGSYTVASVYLGSFAGRVAGAALLIDYVLTVSVSVTAGVLALVSLWPTLQPHIIELNLVAVGIIALVNLRGTKESGVVFAIPTYTFIALTLTMVVYGLVYILPRGIHYAPTNPNQQTEMSNFGVFLLMRAFASGCTALTGIEAISNGVQAFKKPESRNASLTLGVMAAILALMFLGSSWLAQHLNVVPMNQDSPGYKTVLALICSRVFGTGAYFYALQIATALILILAANTAFADFPRLSSIIARDNFLPRQLSSVGDRLVFQNGIVALTLLSCTLIIAFKGKTDALIPLYAIGVFTAFTLSQFGMVVHQLRAKKYRSVPISLIGGIATAIVTAVILITKTAEGGWIVLVAIAALLMLFSAINRHYKYLANELSLRPSDCLQPVATTVLLLVPRMHRGILQAISYASQMTHDLRAVHVTLGPEATKQIKADWNALGVDIPLVILESPYRSLLQPITQYIDQALADEPESILTVIVPQAVPRHWWQGLLHNNAAGPLKLALKNRKNVVVTNVRYFLH